jgi:hypothetical protein
MRRWLWYAVLSAGFTAVATLAAWPFLDLAGRRGVMFAVALALPLQLALFGGLIAQPSGSPGFLAVKVGGTLLRLAVVGIATLVVAGNESIDTLTALLALAGLLFVLLLLEPWVLRGRGQETDRTGQTGNES